MKQAFVEIKRHKAKDKTNLWYYRAEIYKGKGFYPTGHQLIVSSHNFASERRAIVSWVKTAKKLGVKKSSVKFHEPYGLVYKQYTHTKRG